MTLGEFRKKTKDMDDSIRMPVSVSGNIDDAYLADVFKGKCNGLQTLSLSELEYEESEGGYIGDYDEDVCMLVVVS
jgi:hypothetical protein